MNKSILNCFYLLYKARKINDDIFLNFNKKFKNNRNDETSYVKIPSKKKSSEIREYFKFSFISKIYKTHRVFRQYENQNTLVIVISSDRIFKNIQLDISSIYDVLYILLEDQQDKKFFKKFRADAQSIILIDVNSKSILRDYFEELKEKNILLIDQEITRFLFVLKIFSFIGRLFLNALNLIKSFYLIHFSYKIDFRTSIKYLLISIFNKILFNDFKSLKVLITTSNSFFAEYFRFMFLEHKKCSQIIEVLHGVADVNFQAYFEFINYSYPKHTFIPLFRSPLIEFNSKMYDNYSVNVYINKCLSNYGLSKERLFNDDILKNIYPFFPSIKRNRVVVQFIGGNSNDTCFFKSNIFRYELQILHEFSKVLLNYNFDAVFIYCPHPAHQSVNLNSMMVFNDLDLYISQDTISTLFISDISISIFSTALFEAKFLGNYVFTPITYSDQLFSENNLEYLMERDLILENNENQKIKKFILDIKIDSSRSFIEKANNKLLNYFT